MQRPVELLLTVLQRPEGSALGLGQSYAVDRPARIGRAGAVDLLLPDRSVSRDHAELWPTPTGWWIRNRAPHNGLFIDGAGLGAGDAAALRDGARLQLGGVVLAVQQIHATQPWAEALTDAPAGPVEPPARFVIRRDGDACTVHFGAQLLDLPPSAASVLAALAERPGEVVHSWDLQDASRARNLPQAVSAIRRALRQLIEAGQLDARRLALAAHLPPTEDGASLLRRVVFARRRHGYGLALPASWFCVHDQG